MILKIDKLARENGVRIIPQISLDGDSNADTVHEWLSNQATKEKIIGDLLSIIKEKDYDGIHVNFEDVYYEDKELFNEFVADLYNSFHSNGLLVTLFVRMGDATYDSNLLAQVSDHIIIKASDSAYRTR